jgi:hypothetical protein
MGYVSYRCAHPGRAPLNDRRAAIVAARNMWICISGETSISSEADWVSNMEASLESGVWNIGSPVPEGYAGGGLNMFLAQSDGHLVNVYLTQ